ncbi:MAG: hypothetical protein KME46_20655 [Brasilonema angustatum HA4187-MV1]|nr:hypothetical protein [Brasilonema angustatum HA4187-MV1]
MSIRFEDFNSKDFTCTLFDDFVGFTKATPTQIFLNDEASILQWLIGCPNVERSLNSG